MDPDAVDLWTLDPTPEDPLRTVLATYLNVEPEAVPLTRTPTGKPQLASMRGPAFSLAHTGDLAVVAVTARPAVGVDIELAGRRAAERTIRRALTDDERRAIDALDSPDARAEAFLRHWTVKEAYVKALGTGLSTGLNTVAVADALTAPRLVVADGADRWSVQRFDPRPGVIGAVVVAGAPWTPVPRSAARSL
jgi:4'-phosphopantetheinyl transferase